MNIKQIENILINSGIEPNEAKAEARMFVQHFLGLSGKDLILNDEISEIGREDLLEKMMRAVNLRAQSRQPIQHILGIAHFMGEDFIVNEHVLIPRDETELLVRKAIEIIGKMQKCEDAKRRGGVEDNYVSRDSSHLSPFTTHSLKVLDIGTGSGCIACMIAKLANARPHHVIARQGVSAGSDSPTEAISSTFEVSVLGVDISTDALQVALDNATKLNLFNKAIFRKSDVYSNVKPGEKFDVIVSNPPYIPLSEKGKLQKEVEFDPELALFAPDEEGIEFYKKIVEGVPQVLNKCGYLAFELGIGQAQRVLLLMEQNGFSEIEIIQDLAGIDRVICGFYKH